MPPKVLGGYLLTYQEVADSARKLGLDWNDNPEILLGCRTELNRWMKAQDPRLWPCRLQPIRVEESGETITKLMFPTVMSKLEIKDRDFRYNENEGTTARFREAARKLGMPDELFENKFVTLFDPDITFIAPPRPRRHACPC
jgi:hypothetical protein